MIDPAPTDVTPPQTLRDASLIKDAGALLLAQTLGFEDLRFVGGCVRDTLLKRSIKDIDLATTLPPDRVLELLKAANIKTVLTGFAFGTITALLADKAYEITSLRRDIETDGRHAVVVYTEDWCADAARRDFTINALSADFEGRIYDYFDGFGDLETRRLRFVGDPAKRIMEDSLRILRFFRFLAVLDRFSPDTESLSAIEELAPLTKHLSRERIGSEIRKLLTAKNPTPTWQLMERLGVVRCVLPFPANLKQLTHVVLLEQSFGPTSGLCRLAALFSESPLDATAKALVLSNKEKIVFNALIHLSNKKTDHWTSSNIRHLLYKNDPALFRESLFLMRAISLPCFRTALSIIETWEKPTFPLRGADLLNAGFSEGADLGVALRTAEDWWIAQDFTPSRAACLTHLKKIKK